MAVSAYEKVASLLLALLILCGISVVCLLVVWFTSRIFASPPAIPVELVDVGGGRQEGIVGESLTIEAPDAGEIGRESDLVDPQIQNTLSMVTDAVAVRQADLDDPALTESDEGGYGGLRGDSRQIGKGLGAGEPGIPRPQRWEIIFQEGATLQTYARQLDFFKIELCVIGGSTQVQYALNFTKPQPDRRSGAAGQETRLYMSWRSGTLQAADQELLARAGVPTENRIVVQFIPADVENRLAELEQRFANRRQSEIRKTRFGVRSVGNGFEFYVIEQTPL
ncbi:MAG: hypothetical protein HY000_41770 [Planctomycetes bacterium]|nr:hypothetical protein [Planctomycetota bacterium]